MVGDGSQPVHSDNGKSINLEDNRPKQLPKGVVLGPDGKPCRSCTSFASWATKTKAQGKPDARNSSTGPELAGGAAIGAVMTTLPAHCPPDVEALGRSGWTILHSITAQYPETAPAPLQTQARSFVALFAKLYPCSHCAQDFDDWMTQPRNSPQVGGREEFGRWMCAAHNAVNTKLGKPEFDCNKWRERWVDGPADGSCG